MEATTPDFPFLWEKIHVAPIKERITMALNRSHNSHSPEIVCGKSLPIQIHHSYHLNCYRMWQIILKSICKSSSITPVWKNFWNQSHHLVTIHWFGCSCATTHTSNLGTWGALCRGVWSLKQTRSNKKEAKMIKQQKRKNKGCSWQWLQVIPRWNATRFFSSGSMHQARWRCQKRAIGNPTWWPGMNYQPQLV